MCRHDLRASRAQKQAKIIAFIYHPSGSQTLIRTAYAISTMLSQSNFRNKSFSKKLLSSSHVCINAHSEEGTVYRGEYAMAVHKTMAESETTKGFCMVVITFQAKIAENGANVNIDGKSLFFLNFYIHSFFLMHRHFF